MRKRDVGRHGTHLYAYVEAFTALSVGELEATLTLKDQLTQQARTAIGSLSSQLGGITSVAATVGSALGIAFSVRELISLINNTIAFASHLDDLSRATNISTTALQGLGFAGQRVGIDLDQIAMLVGQLSRRIATGDDSAVSAVQSLGLKLSVLMQMNPDELFITLAEAVSRINDPIAQAGIGSQLFGRQYQAAMRMASSGIRDTIKDAEDMNAILGPQSIATLDEFGDKVGDITMVLKVLAAQALTPAVDALLSFFDISRQLGGTRLVFIDPEQQAIFEQFQRTLRDTKPVVTSVAEGFDALHFKINITGESVSQLAAGNTNIITSAQLVENRLKALREDALMPLDREQRAHIDELLEWGVKETEIASLIGTSVSAVHRYIQATQDLVAVKQLELQLHEALGLIYATNRTRLEELNAIHLRLANEGVAAETAAHAANNLALGTSLSGELALKSAYDVMIAALDELHRKKEFAISIGVALGSQEQQEIAIMNEYTAAVYGEAVAQDAAAAAAAQHNRELEDQARAADAAAAALANQMYTMNTMFSLDPNNPNSMAARAALLGGQVAFDSYGNPYIWIPGVNAAPPGTPGMASGGDVSAGSAYMVGERGPELFVPESAGSILPHGAAGMSITNHIYVTQPFGTPDAIGDAIVARQKAQGVRFPARGV